MEIYLVRHAVAVPRGGDALDHARPLTPKGRTRFEREVRGLFGLGIRFDRVYHSPWTRAAQTAELLQPVTKGEHVVTERLARTPDSTLLEEIRGTSVALVGHEPWMSELVSILLLGTSTHADRFKLKKGAVVHLEGDPRAAGCSLIGFYPPRPLRRMTE
jgi:phosphohistidine phosphatase